MNGNKEKLNATKLLNLAPTLLGRLKRVAGMTGDKENEIIRRGLIAELDRIEASASVEAVRMAKLKELAEANGGDIDAVLDRLINEHKQPTLGLTSAA